MDRCPDLVSQSMHIGHVVCHQAEDEPSCQRIAGRYINVMDYQDNLPLSEAVFFILLSLAQEPKHGYAIMKDVETLSDSRISLSTGTLYGALKRLLDGGWIRRVDEGQDETSRGRKFYALTQFGKGILKAETTRMQYLVAVAKKCSSEGGII